MCNTYCFCTATTVTRTPFNINFIRISPVSFSSPKGSDPRWASFSFLYSVWRGSFLGVKAGDDHLPPFSAEHNSGLNCVSASLYTFMACIGTILLHVHNRVISSLNCINAKKWNSTPVTGNPRPSRNGPCANFREENFRVLININNRPDVFNAVTDVLPWMNWSKCSATFPIALDINLQTRILYRVSTLIFVTFLTISW
jgi:hypothetical protein